MTLPDFNPATSRARLSVEPTGYDRILIWGFVLPGKARLTSGGDYKIREDKKQAPGKNHATTTTYGVEFSDLQIEVTVWLESQRDELARITQELAGLMKKDPTAAVVSIDVPHVADLGITAALVKTISPLRPGSERGMWSRVFTLSPWVAPQPATATPKVATAKRSQKAKKRKIHNGDREAAEQNTDPSKQQSIAGPNQSVAGPNQSVP